MRGLACVLTCFLQITFILATQFPITWKEPQLLSTKEPLDIGSAQWNLGITPSDDSTGRFVFDSVSALAQHWPNTRYRHGHNIVPAIIPPGTLLYHGTSVHVVPTGPEWTSVDPEHAYLFCRNVTVGGGCWQLTLVTTRTLNLLYFDGSSAAKLEDGSLDSQDVLAWGAQGPDRNHRENERVKMLCDWGAPIDGFVRMEMDFEVVLCDFTQGVEMVSFLNLVSQSLPSDPQPPIPDFGMFPAETGDPLKWLSVIEAGSWHNRYPGDMRIQLDLTRLVSFYDTVLFSSLVPLRRGQERWSHRLKGISNTDAESLKRRLRMPKANNTSGIDWLSLIRVIKHRYEERLEVARYILNPIVAETADVTMQRFTTHLQRLIAPYNILTATPPEDTTFNHSWVAPVYENCASTHTAYISGPTLLKLTQSEKLILESIQDVNGEICRVIVIIWGESVEHAKHTNHANITTTELFSRWKQSIEGLMAWLDWNEWAKCNPECGFEEMCYLPTWPFFLFDKDEDWFRPQPRCIRRISPVRIFKSG